ncbi:InlB B-repeat-containing protein [Aquiflexum sp.]|uniref:InlB B-repeat-containing protein n=1 Tax=Aquiflexum sp. TaxID=1872584 RepID=UPI003592FD18
MKTINFSRLILIFSYIACTAEEDPQVFSLTVNNGSGGGTFASGEIVNIHANAPAENQVFQVWTGDIETLENASSESTTITMPSKNVVVNATYRTFNAQNIVNVSADFSSKFQTMEGFGFFGARDVWWGNANAAHFHSDAWLEMIIGDLGLSMWRNEVYPHLPVTDNTAPNQDAHWDKQRPMVQALKAKADQYNVDLRVILTAWTPPGSFKWNAWGYNWPGDQNAQRGPGSDGDFWPERGVPRPGESPSHNSGTLNPNKYDDFAQWWIDAIQMYKEIGISVYAISPQNEPAFNQFYNSCFYTTHWYAEMINGVIPKIKAAHPEVLIFGSEHMLQNEGRESDFPFFYHNRLKQDPTAMTHIDALAVHGYLDGVNVSSGTDLARYWSNHKREFSSDTEKRVWMTETSGYEDSWEATGDRPGALGMGMDIATAINFGDLSLGFTGRAAI